MTLGDILIPYDFAYKHSFCNGAYFPSHCADDLTLKMIYSYKTRSKLRKSMSLRNIIRWIEKHDYKPNVCNRIDHASYILRVFCYFFVKEKSIKDRTITLLNYNDDLTWDEIYGFLDLEITKEGYKLS